MSLVVIGGDFLGGIEKKLYELGVTELTHISGRKAGDRNRIPLPKATDLILILTDYLNHSTAKNMKVLAKSQDIPLVYAKRSWCDIEAKLQAGKFLAIDDCRVSYS